MKGLGLYWGNIGLILGLCWGSIGIMEKKMETTITIMAIAGWMSLATTGNTSWRIPPN